MRDIELEVTDIKNIIILIIYDKIHKWVLLNSYPEFRNDGRGIEKAFMCV